MSGYEATAVQRFFSVSELLETVLLSLLDDLVPIEYGTDPRSAEYDNAASVLRQLLSCSQVNKSWHQAFLQSKPLQRALYLLPITRTQRSWDANLRDQDQDKLPMLNPLLVALFRQYQFRFWRISFDANDHRPCAFLLIERRDLPNLEARAASGHGRTISQMLLAQPPCTTVTATIWDERDETKDYVGRTTTLASPDIHCATGLTMGHVHERVAEMFAEHQDVTAIKLTTI